jgi:hypothetical protein
MGLIKRIRQTIKLYKWSKTVKQEDIKKFLQNVKQEASEYKEVGEILAKYARREKLTKEDEEKFKEQFFDTLKILGIGIPFTLIPGASVLLPLVMKVAKKYEIDILPSSFNKEENDTEKIETDNSR